MENVAVLVTSQSQVYAIRKGHILSTPYMSMKSVYPNGDVAVNANGDAYCSVQWYVNHKYELISFNEWQKRTADETTEVTLDEIARKFNVDVSKLRIKE